MASVGKDDRSENDVYTRDKAGVARVRNERSSKSKLLLLKLRLSCPSGGVDTVQTSIIRAMSVDS